MDPNESDASDEKSNHEGEEHGAEVHAEVEGGEQGGLSKKQKKKLQKKAKWEKLKKIKRKEQKQKDKAKRKQKREQAQLVEPPPEQGDHMIEHGDKHTKRRKDEYREKMIDGVKVVVDLQFYDLMTEKQCTSLGKQLAYCHSVNRKAEKPFNFIISSFTEPRRQFMAKKYSIDNFGITLLQQNLLQAWPKEKIVYLTGDAEQQLTGFIPEQIYIIGGIVDHNRLKNITIDYAQKHGLKARRLPMSGLKLKASVHLAVNHVWEWMLRHYNGQSWKDAIKAVIPERKLQQCQKEKGACEEPAHKAAEEFAAEMH